MPGEIVLIAADELREFAADLLRRADLPAPDAMLTADSLVAANLRGVDSHGVQLIPPYVHQIRAGNIRPGVRGKVVSIDGSCIVYDGEFGVGQVTARECCEHAIRTAKHHGMASVAAREANHFGAAAYWAQMMSKEGMMGMVFCNATALVAPWQGREARFGTNPICVSLPGPNQWLLDMATTTVAMNRIYKAEASGEPTIPEGWALDAQGQPTTVTAEAVKGSPMPLGGYKGSGLAFLIEILCAVLSGGAISTQVGGLRVTERPIRTSHFFLAMDVARFMPIPEFTARMDMLVSMVKSSAPAVGYEEVLVAGEPEWRTEAERRENGIPIAKSIWESLEQLK
ncbi:malate dehydrogenase [Bryobacterales bacterium F-183]|nr:malate dehydrogenase [Bryobacterales bacterium F-183]